METEISSLVLPAPSGKSGIPVRRHSLLITDISVSVNMMIGPVPLINKSTPEENMMMGVVNNLDKGIRCLLIK